MQKLDDVTFDHVMRWQIENIISHLLQRLESPNSVRTHTRRNVTRFLVCHLLYSFMSMSYMSCDRVVY